jgi:tRNA G18 (ribose-2'-O)-methylase SpoU
MSKEKIRTVPNLADNSPIHQAALASGDERFYSWQYNVADHLKSKTVEEIRKLLKDTAYPFAVCFENVVSDFNLSSGMRNANAFNASKIFYHGIKKYDRRGAVGIFNYSDIKWLSTIDELIALKEKYVFVGADNIEGAVSVYDYSWKANSLLCFGNETAGLTPGLRDMCQDIVYIPQKGSVRSLNIATASGIIMSDYVRKYEQIKQ